MIIGVKIIKINVVSLPHTKIQGRIKNTSLKKKEQEETKAFKKGSNVAPPQKQRKESRAITTGLLHDIPRPVGPLPPTPLTCYLYDERIK